MLSYIKDQEACDGRVLDKTTLCQHAINTNHLIKPFLKYNKTNLLLI